MTVDEAIKNSKRYNINTLEVLLLLEKILKTSKELILANKNQSLTKKAKHKFLNQINDVKSGIPIHYILKVKEFMGINFYINKDVLIPRADTECLVEEALAQIQKNNLSRILDLCCGSGCIGLTIAHYLRRKVKLSDFSIKALKVAFKNTKRLKLESYVEIIYSNLLKCINEEFEIIITNPPYLSKDELREKERLGREPRLALLGFGRDGLELARKIIQQSKHKLARNGLLLMELAPWQIDPIGEFAVQEGFLHLNTLRDIESRERAVVLRIANDTTL
ncbi:peptide chain release factor N(5)-glutamine methyltransferase [Borrelia sp. BU AG58]|uniref:peptide chain release factor N(5)-glutamine methyltransferase n=1 Tax=Borrelia sp. BU AG58 TaxID=2887345 RepID=UPI001E3DDC81|nr:peptide chain release factor N(5)-glutamine methyltransferase [Borrelia sp. BU AG58]UER67392.1 peptide chain release factor N(5)-glutamine methyltransferase [Borrelia sp. BU AG58]